ncbi:hypothetical protein [Neorhizobium sp. T7_12]|uniref:hypothetical protein n=1 Tax=Neorhizobium sp. T7_12 TaxID=2093832 RepID=UPI000CF9FB9A|nr:hypothetical protein [Neorhizobium sp. T7_12]
METFVTNLTTAAAVSTSLIAVFAVIAALVKATRFLANLPQEVRTYFFKPRYLVIPTPEELAKYAVQEFEANRLPSREQWLEELRGHYVARYRAWRKMSCFRVKIIAIGFAAFYFVALGVLINRGSNQYTEGEFAKQVVVGCWVILLVGSVIWLAIGRVGSMLRNYYWNSQ